MQESLGDGLDGQVESSTADRANEILASLSAFDDSESWVVRGIVSDPNGNPMAHLVVRAIDRDLGRRELLGDARTDGIGRYEIRYSPRRAGRAESGAPDLQIQAFDAEALDRMLAECRAP